MRKIIKIISLIGFLFVLFCSLAQGKILYEIHKGAIWLEEITEPTAPSTGYVVIYATSDTVHIKSDTTSLGLTFDGAGTITTSSDNLTLSPASGEVEWASVWQEQRAHVTQFYKPGTNYPGEGEIGVTPVLFFNSANDEWTYYEWEVPENYHAGSGIKLRFAWAPTDTSTGSVIWATEYTIITPNNNEALTATATTKTVTDSAESLANELLLTDFITISGTDIQSGDIISMRIFRDADNGADDYGADAALVHIGLYFKIDRNGVASL